jgi:hypothetical protein
MQLHRDDKFDPGRMGILYLSEKEKTEIKFMGQAIKVFFYSIPKRELPSKSILLQLLH